MADGESESALIIFIDPAAGSVLHETFSFVPRELFKVMVKWSH